MLVDLERLLNVQCMPFAQENQRLELQCTIIEYTMQFLHSFSFGTFFQYYFIPINQKCNLCGKACISPIIEENPSQS